MGQELDHSPVEHESRRMTRGRPFGFAPEQARLLALAGTMLVANLAALWLGPIVRGDDTFSSFAHLDAWTAALKAGNPLSVWTPTDANGFGSPMPFFYHKLFNLVGAMLGLFAGDIVTGFRLAVLFFSSVMFWGVYQCATRLDLDRPSRFVAATACVLSPYAINNIVERCAVAEYSAMALIPCILALVLDFHTGANRKWRAPTLIALLVSLALAHVLIFVAAAGLLLVLSLYRIASAQSGGWALACPSLVAVAAFVGLIYVPFTHWSALFCAGQASVFGKPGNYVVPMLYVLLPFPWSRLGWPGTALLIAIYFRLRQGKARSDDLALGLGVVAILLILIMTPVAKPLWQLSSKADFFQFPWRVLAIATPIAIVALFGLIERLEPTRRRRMQFDLLVVAIFNLGLTLCWIKWRPMTPVTIPLAELRHQVPSSGPGPDATGEYFPVAFQARLNQMNFKVWGTSASSALPVRRPLVEASGCEYSDVARPTYFDTLWISSVCAYPGHVRINQFSTPFLDSMATNDSGAVVRPVANAQVIEFALPPGHWTITVRQRSYIELVEMAWLAQLHDWAGDRESKRKEAVAF
ncbi:Membrane protein, 6-pyruvoyl-tetrahydropterin synthase-related domain containing protein [Burkholderia sp. lig30]|jgi:hypothetical protein|uniref:hypothetical protein n=1 Tax=Burkholderia sp. lig30 TaxID=1192124 RepID=UPI000460F410|nr:hypothetical protein [Burkholderia sp. lig30]KDB07697.1 Membrane protein, 6-pyruvoyl-tetrahydropterin synthase-related domain containing protein [Burkholderia sp. lig30]